MQNFKSVSTRKIHQWMDESNEGEEYPEAPSQRIWQRNYYDHIIRNQKELDRIKAYILDNPRRWREDQEYVE